MCIRDRETLWLDDQTGQMVAFTELADGPGTLVVEEKEAGVEEFLIFPEAVWNAAEFCRVHYPVDEVKLARETEGDVYKRQEVFHMNDICDTQKIVEQFLKTEIDLNML